MPVRMSPFNRHWDERPERGVCKNYGQVDIPKPVVKSMEQLLEEAEQLKEKDKKDDG